MRNSTQIHIAVDDATGTITSAYFNQEETLNGYYHVFHQILTHYGIPYNFFTDRRTVFEEQPSDKKFNLILAVLTERTVNSGHCLKFQKKYYRMLDESGMQVHYRKGTKVLLI